MNSASRRRIGSAVSTIGRLTRRADFLAAANGRRFHNERMSAQGLLRGADPAPDAAPGLRVGFTITKRVGHATERNRIRRRLRAALAASAEALPDLAADVVLVARRPALHAPFETLIDDLRRAVGTVTKPPKTGETRPASGNAPRRGRGRGIAAVKPAGASAAAPVSASGVADAAATASGPDRARAPSSPSNACDGPTDG